MDPVSAIGLADNCISFATALYGYITVVVSIKDDILSTINELEATGAVLRDLGHLIQKFHTSGAWKAERMVYAETCIAKAENNISKMRRLLLKTSPSTSSNLKIEREDIDVAKLERLLFWPYRKSKLDPRRAELAASKIDILLAYTMYLAAATPDSVDGKNAKAQLPELYRAKRVMVENVRDVKARGRQGPGKSRRRGYSTTMAGPGPAGDPAYPGVDFGEGALLYESEDAIRRDFEDWKRREEEVEKKAEEQRQALEAKAVEAWKKAEREKAERQIREIHEQRARLAEELRKQHMAPQQIQSTLDHLHPIPQLGGQLASTLLADGKEAPTQEPPNVEVGKPTRLHLGSGRSWWSRFRGPPKMPPTLPSMFLDPTRPGGLAKMTTLMMERRTYPTGVRVVTTHVNCDFLWLVRAVHMTNARVIKSGINPAGWELAQLPEDYRTAISSELDYSKSELLLIHSVRSSRLSSVFSKSQDRVQLVYLALKEPVDASPHDTSDVNDPHDPAFREKLREKSRGKSRRPSRNHRYYSSSSSGDSDSDGSSRSRTRRNRSNEGPVIASRASRVRYDTSERPKSYSHERSFVAPVHINEPSIQYVRKQDSSRSRRGGAHTRQYPSYSSLSDEDYFGAPTLVETRTRPIQHGPGSYARNGEPARDETLWETRGSANSRLRRPSTLYSSYRRDSVPPRPRRRVTSDSYGSARRMTTDSYSGSRHARFADDDSDDKVIVEEYDSSSSSTSDVEDQILNLKSEKEGNVGSMSDAEIVRQLLSPFGADDPHEPSRSASAPAAIFGGQLSEEPQSALDDTARGNNDTDGPAPGG